MSHLLKLDIVVGISVTGDDTFEELGGGHARCAAGWDEFTYRQIAKTRYGVSSGSGDLDKAIGG